MTDFHLEHELMPAATGARLTSKGVKFPEGIVQRLRAEGWPDEAIYIELVECVWPDIGLPSAVATGVIGDGDWAPANLDEFLAGR